MLIRHISSFNRVFKKPSPNSKVGSECDGGFFFFMRFLVCIILITPLFLFPAHSLCGEARFC